MDVPETLKHTDFYIQFVIMVTKHTHTHHRRSIVRKGFEGVEKQDEVQVPPLISFFLSIKVAQPCFYSQV